MNKAYNRELNEIYSWLSKEEAKIYNKSAENGIEIGKDAFKELESEASFKIKMLKDKYGVEH